MTQAIPLDDRVTDLERRMGDVEHLASATDREVAGWQNTLNGHTKLLNAIRDDVGDQGKKVDRLETEMRDGFAKVDEKFAEMDENFAKVDEKFTEMEANFTKVDENFAKMDEQFTMMEAKFTTVDENFARVAEKFTLLQQGQDQITHLLTRHLDEPDEEPHAGGADE
jgi:chromosome segregation ATPase